MDRLPALIVCICLVAACDDDGSRKRRPTSSRVNAVAAEPKKPVSVEQFCDVYSPAPDAPTFAFPELVDNAAAMASGWHWVNVWATWCKPCIEEMPTLMRWRERLGSFDLVFVSVDETAEEIETFRKKNTWLPPSLQVKNTDDLETWVESLGLEKNAAIPIHAFVDGDVLRCVRTGSLGPSHFDTIAKLTSQ